MSDERPTEIPSVLACDVGNSALHVACVRGDEVTDAATFRLGRLEGLGDRLAELWAHMPAPKRIVACSVNAAGLKALEAAVSAAMQADVLVVGRDTPLPIDTRLDEPQKVGVDRLCAAVAAFDRLGQACVVADFGSAITIDCVNDDGQFLGGAILPGLSMGADALHAGTAQLPRVKLARPDWVIGRNTNEAIVGGLVFAARGALRHLVEAYANELGHWPVVIATGGDAELVCPEVRESELVQAIVPDLVLRGVAAAYYRTLLK